jgi:hypothetical protein
VPGTEKSLRVRAETLLVQEGCGEVVPALERTTVNTRDLVVRKPVVLVLGHEPLHTEKVQVPLVGIARQRTELETGSSSPAAIALAVGRSAGAAHTSDGNEALLRLTLGEFTLDLVDVGLNGSICVAGRVSVVVRAMLESDCELENGQEGDEHGHHAGGFAEVGHREESSGCFLCLVEGPERPRVWKEVDSKNPKNEELLKPMLKSVTTFGLSPEGLERKRVL